MTIAIIERANSVSSPSLARGMHGVSSYLFEIFRFFYAAIKTTKSKFVISSCTAAARLRLSRVRRTAIITRAFVIRRPILTRSRFHVLFFSFSFQNCYLYFAYIYIYIRSRTLHTTSRFNTLKDVDCSFHALHVHRVCVCITRAVRDVPQYYYTLVQVCETDDVPQYY